MKVKKIPMRTCVVTNKVMPKKDLIRITVNKEGVVSVDLTGKAHGRGAYLTLNKEVILKAQESKILNKRLNTNVDDNIYEKLMELVKNG